MKQAIAERDTGFTLVEAIITGVIVAIVTIAAVVAYGGYIKEARRQTVENLAEAAAVAANAYVRRTNQNLETGDSAKLKLYFSNPADYQVAINPNGGDLHGSVVIRDVSDQAHVISVSKAY